MGCLPLRTCSVPSATCTNRRCWCCSSVQESPVSLKGLDSTSHIHPPEHCQSSVHSALHPIPAPGRSPPQVTTQIPDKIQRAGSNRPPPTTGIGEPSSLEGLRQHWKHSLLQPHWHLVLPMTKAGRFCLRALVTPPSPEWGPAAAQGLFLWGLFGGAGGVPPFSSHKCTIL